MKLTPQHARDCHETAYKWLYLQKGAFLVQLFQFEAAKHVVFLHAFVGRSHQRKLKNDVTRWELTNGWSRPRLSTDRSCSTRSVACGSGSVPG